MTTPGTGPPPIGPNNIIDAPPASRDVVQTSELASPAKGSTGSSLAAAHNYYDRMKPAATIQRYERSTKLEPPYIDVNLPPLTTSFVDGEEPQGWAPLEHPEGALYWVHEWQEGEKAMPVYTDAYLYEEDIFVEIERFREAIFCEIRKKEKGDMPDEWELVLDLDGCDGSDERICHYYFVNCSNRSMFWFHHFDVTPLLHGLADVKTKRRIQQALESFYWNHWEMFPHDREIPEKFLKELVGIMVHAGLDDMTSNGSTSIYSGEELQKFISYVERIKFIGGADGYSACIVGRLMKFFSQGRYINFFAQREARLSTDQSIFWIDAKKRRTWLLSIVSLLMFFAPEVHLKALNTVYTDFVLCQHKWAKFIYKVQNEWREVCRIGTVLLTANVAFLAIPSVDNVTNNFSNGIGAAGYPRTPAQVTSFISVVFSLGALAIGQLLLRHHMIRPQDSAEEVDKYLGSYHDTRRGLGTLAVLYSLPYALLLWAITSFFVAFVFMSLVDSAGVWQRYPTTAVMFIFIVLLIWCIWTTWEGRTDFMERTRDSDSRKSGQGKHTPDGEKPRKRRSQESLQIHSIHIDSPARST